MEVDTSEKPFPYLLIRDFYDEKELALIWQELEFLTYKTKFDPPAKTGQRDPGAKKNSGVFLDEVYMERRFSNILKVNRKLFSAQIMKMYSELHFTYESIMHVNRDTTLISYYENAAYYKPHHDQAAITALTWFFKEPKQFSGGELVFTAYNEKIEVKNNCLLVFPSCVRHEVTPIKMEGSPTGFSGLGRYCMSQFMSYN